MYRIGDIWWDDVGSYRIGPAVILDIEPREKVASFAQREQLFHFPGADLEDVDATLSVECGNSPILSRHKSTHPSHYKSYTYRTCKISHYKTNF